MTRRKVNNKISRRKAVEKAQVPQDQEVVLEGLNTRDSRRKLRRFGFQALVEFPAKNAVDAEGKPIEGQIIPAQKKILRLDRMVMTTAQGARIAAKQELAVLLGNVGILSECNVKMEVLPHETISRETFQLIQAYVDIERICQRALINAAKRAMILSPVIPNEGEPEMTAEAYAEQIYRDAADELRQEIKAAKLAAEEALLATHVDTLPADQAHETGSQDGLAHQQEAVEEDQQETDEKLPVRRLGIEAYNEIMSNPAE